MSDPILDDAELENDVMEPESDSVGQTSEEASESGEDKKKREFSVYDAMLLVSLICVTLATLLLVIELGSFGNVLFGFPWRTTEVLNLLWF